MLPKNHDVLSKMPILLRPYKLKHTFIHLRLKSSVGPILRNNDDRYISFLDDRYISFLDVLDLSLLKYDQNTLGVYCFSEQWCCQKRHVFLLKMLILLRP